MEFAVFVMVKVEADTKEKAERAVAIALDNAIADDTHGLRPEGILRSHEHQDTV